MDPTEPNDQAKYEKKLFRDPSYGFAQATKEMCQGATKCILQNNEIDLFEEYFAGEQPEHLSESISTKTLMIFKDPNNIKRAATSIAWHPENTELRVGVTYAMLRFQQMPTDMPRESYIWNLNDPNFPEKTLMPPSPLCTMAFNHKNSDIVVGGSYNGSLSFFDTRQGNSQGVVKPFRTTILEKSHHDPVYDVYWLTLGKTGSECVSGSTDGRLLWWDMKSQEEGPVDQLVLNEKIPVDGDYKDKVLGCTSIEYNSDAGPLKYLIGTEQGYILQANKRKQIEINQRFGVDNGKHHGPIYSLYRNPQHSKYFLSVGDWSAKVWSEELKSPIMQTRYHSAYLTDGCWSQTRCGLFYLTRIDGFLDVWDFYYRQNEVAYSQKISDSPLTSISVNNNMAAIGDAEGTVSIMQLCKPLYETTPKEKETMQHIFEREFRREKSLEIAKKQATDVKPAKPKADAEKAAKAKEEALATRLTTIEETFFKDVAEDEADLTAIKARGAEGPRGGDLDMGATSSSVKAAAVELAAGSTHTFKVEAAVYKFEVEAGGVISGEKITGSVHSGKVIFTAEGTEYEGNFTGPNVIDATFKKADGSTGKCTIQMD